MDSFLPIIYLSFLLTLLGSAGWIVFRQIIKTRKIESAISRLQTKLNKEKGTAQEYYELGSIYLDKKLFAQAATQLQKALKAPDLEGDENTALIYNALGFAYFAQEQYDLSIRHYKEALKLDPNYVTALNNLGHVYERKQLTSQALEAYETALKLDPQSTVAKRRSDALRKRLAPTA